jgi:hypothetical protein
MFEIEYTIFAGLIGSFITWQHGTDQDMVQRMLTRPMCDAGARSFFRS